MAYHLKAHLRFSAAVVNLHGPKHLPSGTCLFQSYLARKSGCKPQVTLEITYNKRTVCLPFLLFTYSFSFVFILDEPFMMHLNASSINTLTDWITVCNQYGHHVSYKRSFSSFDDKNKQTALYSWLLSI